MPGAPQALWGSAEGDDTVPGAPRALWGQLLCEHDFCCHHTRHLCKGQPALVGTCVQHSSWPPHGHADWSSRAVKTSAD